MKAKSAEFKPGVHPLGARVLIKPDEEVLTEDGGLIVIPDTIKEKYRDAQTIGTVVELGPTAFAFEEKTYGADTRSKVVPGTRVMFAKYGGVVIKGSDGKDYRQIWDDDIFNIAEPGYKIPKKGVN